MKSVKKIYSHNKEKKITKKLYSSIINSIKFYIRMVTRFMNSEKSKTSDSYRLLFNLSDNIDSKRIDKYVALSNLSL